MVLLALLLLSIAVGCMPATVQPQKINLVFFMAVRRCANHARTSCCWGHRRGGARCPPARTTRCQRQRLAGRPQSAGTAALTKTPLLVTSVRMTSATAISRRSAAIPPARRREYSTAVAHRRSSCWPRITIVDPDPCAHAYLSHAYTTATARSGTSTSW